MSEFDKLFELYKGLNDEEKEKAIIEFLKNNIYHLNEINKRLNNDYSVEDISSITNAESTKYLDIIYQLLHVMTEQVEMFTEKVSNNFYE